MEFIIFLSKLDKEILDLLIKANYEVEENKIECLINKEIKGLHNFAFINKSRISLSNLLKNIINSIFFFITIVGIWSISVVDE